MSWYRIELKRVDAKQGTLPKDKVEKNKRKPNTCLSDRFIEDKITQLRLGDTVTKKARARFFGNSYSQVEVKIIDEDRAKVRIVQSELEVFLSSAAVNGIKRYDKPLLSRNVETIVEKQNIYIAGDALSGEVVIKWVEDKVDI